MISWYSNLVTNNVKSLPSINVDEISPKKSKHANKYIVKDKSKSPVEDGIYFTNILWVYLMEYSY